VVDVGQCEQLPPQPARRPPRPLFARIVIAASAAHRTQVIAARVQPQGDPERQEQCGGQRRHRQLDVEDDGERRRVGSGCR